MDSGSIVQMGLEHSGQTFRKDEQTSILSKGMGRFKVSVEEILRAVAEELDTRVSDILTASRARSPAHARAIVAYLAREPAGLPLTAVAREVRRDPVTLSHAVRRLESLLVHSLEVRHRIDRVVRHLRGSRKLKNGKGTA